MTTKVKVLLKFNNCCHACIIINVESKNLAPLYLSIPMPRRSTSHSGTDYLPYGQKFSRATGLPNSVTNRYYTHSKNNSLLVLCICGLVSSQFCLQLLLSSFEPLLKQALLLYKYMNFHRSTL